MKVKEIVIEGKVAPERAVIYIISNDREILYIGKSFRMEDRIIDHFTKDNLFIGVSDFSDYARNNLPESLNWEVGFVEHPEHMKYPERWARDKEYELINIHQPRFNKMGK